nr:DUF1661 domain-containing protein [Porphyromonas gulae]
MQKWRRNFFAAARKNFTSRTKTKIFSRHVFGSHIPVFSRTT